MDSGLPLQQIGEYFAQNWALLLQGEPRGILFYTALYLPVMAGYSFLYQCRVARWPSVPGRLQESGVTHFGVTEWQRGRQRYRTQVAYAYTVNGKPYTGSRLSTWGMVASHNALFLLRGQLRKMAVGTDGQVQVFYNPTNPRKSVLVKPGMAGRILTLLVAVVPLALYFVAHG